MQKLEIMLPPHMVVLTKEELEEIEEQADDRVWVNFRTVMEWTDLGRDKLDTILKRYRDELDVLNGGCVKYPDGGKWSFEKEGIKQWLKDNHARVWQND